MRKSIHLYVAVAGLLMTGCTFVAETEEPEKTVIISEPGVGIQQKQALELIPEVEYHDSLYIEKIPGIEVDNDGGLFISAERYNVREIYFYSPEGELLDTLGAYGDAPGEFQSIENIQLKDSLLYVFDDQLGRVTLFNTPGHSYQQHFDLQPAPPDSLEDIAGLEFIPVQLWNDGTFLGKFIDTRNPAFYPDRKQYYFIITENGDLNSKPIFELKGINYLIGDHAGRPAAFMLPYSEKSLVTQARDSTIFTAWTEDFSIDRRNLRGEIEKTYLHSYERAELDYQTMIDEEFSHNRQLKLTKESARYPYEWPALHSMIFDDENRLWIAAIPEDKSVFEWWVMDISDGGQLLESGFSWPRKSIFIKAVNGNVYAVESDDAGFKKVVRYRVDFRLAE